MLKRSMQNEKRHIKWEGGRQNGKKVKVKLSLRLTKHQAMKMYWGIEVYLHAFLISALDGGKLSASRPGRFTPRERAPPVPTG
jgi:hypothetical protein